MHIFWSRFFPWTPAYRKVKTFCGWSHVIYVTFGKSKSCINWNLYQLPQWSPHISFFPLIFPHHQKLLFWQDRASSPHLWDLLPSSNEGGFVASPIAPPTPSFFWFSLLGPGIGGRNVINQNEARQKQIKGRPCCQGQEKEGKSRR